MHNSSPGKIERAKIAQPAANSPDPVSQRVINQCRPQKGKHNECFEFQPFCKGTRHEGRCNDGEHHLKDHKCLMWNCRRVVRIGIEANPVQSEPIQATNQKTSGTEGDAVAPEYPLNADQCRKNKTL